MPILGILASQISGHLWAPAGAYDSLATVTVPSGGLASVTFAGIPSGYKHLQIRGISRGTSTLARVAIKLNNDGGANYTIHYLFGDGSVANAGGNANFNNPDIAIIPTSSQLTNAYGAFVTDILDYTNTNKYKTIRTLGGMDINGAGGYEILYSSAWLNTASVTQISLIPGTVGSGNFDQYSSFALYGVK